MSLKTVLVVCACAVLLGTHAASAGRRDLHISRGAKAACMSDALRLCRDAVPNVENVLICFSQHRDKISHRCRAVLVSYGFR